MKKIIFVPLCSTIFILVFGVLTASAVKYDLYDPCYRKLASCVKRCERAMFNSDGFYKDLEPYEIENINICLKGCDRVNDACKKLKEPEDVAEDKERTISLTSISGEVEIKRAGQEGWVNAGKNIELKAGDSIATSFSSSVLLRFSDGSTAQLEEITQIKVESLFTKDGKVRTDIRLRTGGLKARVKGIPGLDTDFKVITPTSVFGVRGTIFHVRYVEETKTANVYVEEGEVSVTDSNGQGEVIVQTNQHTSVAKGRLPQKPISSSKVENPWWEAGSDLSDIWAYINLALMLVGLAFIVSVWKKLKGKNIIIKMIVSVGMAFVILVLIGFLSW